MEAALESIQNALELAQKQRRAIRQMMARGAHCPGVELEPGVWTGCDQGAEGATDCPTHGEDGDALLEDAVRALHLIDEQVRGLTREISRLADSEVVRH